jgi:hypothetical protein
MCAPSPHRSILHRELKRRQKQREKEARRAENPTNQPPAPNNATDGIANEEDLSPNVRWSWRSVYCGQSITDGRILLILSLCSPHSILTTFGRSNILSFVHVKSKDFERHSPQTLTHISLKLLALLTLTSASTVETHPARGTHQLSSAARGTRQDSE